MAGNLQGYLDNWIRWARQGNPQYRSLLGRMYVPSKDELIEDGQWISKPSGPSIPIDEASAVKVEKAILSLPTDKFDQPKLIVWHFIDSRHAPLSKHGKKCRQMRVKLYKYDECLKIALANLQRLLT